MDPVALATPLIEPLAVTTGHTVAVAVWGNRGATMVRIAQPPSPVHISMRHGTVVSLWGTASGRLFAAWLPAAALRPVVRAERAERAAALPNDELERLRKQGFDHRATGAVATPLRAAAAQLSRRLGHPTQR